MKAGAVEIRPLTIAAYEVVYALWLQCDGIGLGDSDSKEAIQRYLERNPGMSFMATDDGEVVGAVLAGHDGRRGFIHHLAVLPAYRRNGLGRLLVDKCLAALKVVGILKCHIFIFNHNLEGLSFWEAMGWSRRNDISVVSKFN
jgi:ribosomal protein S18 acetylase RimI-like enzyme